jgi:hypothetical protein
VRHDRLEKEYGELCERAEDLRKQNEELRVLLRHSFYTHGYGEDPQGFSACPNCVRLAAVLEAK